MKDISEVKEETEGKRALKATPVGESIATFGVIQAVIGTLTTTSFISISFLANIPSPDPSTEGLKSKLSSQGKGLPLPCSTS